MDPVSLIATALASGVIAGLRPTAEQAVKDGYSALKELITRKYRGVPVDLLEQDPKSESRRSVIKEELAKTDAAHDQELLRMTKLLLDSIQRLAPEALGAVGVDLKNVKAGSLNIEGIEATGPGVKGTDIEAQGNITIKDIQAGGRGGNFPKS